MKTGYTYILANKKNWTLYIWVTSNLIQRILQHKEKTYQWFTAQYQVDKLMYYEEYDTIEQAIWREKQLKWGNRKRKIDLIETNNPNRNDLSTERL